LWFHRLRGVPLSALTLYITRPCSRQFPVPGFSFAGDVQNRQVGIAWPPTSALNYTLIYIH